MSNDERKYLKTKIAECEGLRKKLQKHKKYIRLLTSQLSEDPHNCPHLNKHVDNWDVTDCTVPEAKGCWRNQRQICWEYWLRKEEDK